METLFKVEINQDRKMWYEDYFNTLQKKQFKIYHLVCACFASIYIIIMITVWIKQKQIALTGGGIFDSKTQYNPTPYPEVIYKSFTE